ncbi:MAG: T9SS type A sorting domain-containing protein [Flavobacteriia bacterium]|nr:T9SS type A sorting domain-containing protein [Flavobacteriia bacterium]
MKKIKFILFLLSVHYIFSQVEYSIISQNEEEIVLEINFKVKDFNYLTYNNQNYVDFQSIYKIISLEKGAPALPLFGSSYHIPSKGAVEIEIIPIITDTITSIKVLPSKGNLKRNVLPSSVAYEFSEVYSINAFYPSIPVKHDNPFIYRTVRGQNIQFFPFQYNPVSQELVVHKKIKVKIKLNKNLEGVNEVFNQENSSDLKTISYHFKNEKMEKYSTVEEDGEMLILSSPGKASLLTELVHWKNQRGIKTVLKTTDETGQTLQEITSFLDEYYLTNPNLKYLLLVGDSEDIPVHSYGTSMGENLYSDSYYGQLAGTDYYPDVFVGRLSGQSFNIETMVERILEYEKNPLVGDWNKKAIGLASSEGAGYGDEGQADWQHMRGLRDLMIEGGYQQVYEFYDGSRNGDDAPNSPLSSDILDAVNEGVGIFNYTGHGDLTTCITGEFSSSHINQATNYGKYPFVVSVACNNGTFVDATCISESWLNANKAEGPTGAIAACGSSILMAWAPPMETQDELTLINTKNIENNYKTTLGGLFYNAQMSMLEEYMQDGVEVMQTWIFFGDPSVVFRNEITQELNVSHPINLPANIGNTIIVQSETENVEIAFSVNNELIGTAKIIDGQCSFNLPSYANGTVIDVVATKQNYSPYIGQINIQGNSSINEYALENWSIFPNPTNNFIYLKNNNLTIEAEISLYTVDGQLVLNKKINEDFSSKINLTSLNQGIYYLQIKDNQNTFIKKIVKK